MAWQKLPNILYSTINILLFLSQLFELMAWFRADANSVVADCIQLAQNGKLIAWRWLYNVTHVATVMYGMALICMGMAVLKSIDMVRAWYTTSGENSHYQLFPKQLKFEILTIK